jgi:hypothetical protein
MPLFRRKRTLHTAGFNDPLSVETEHLISLQQGLLAALKIITFQKEAFDDLKGALSSIGMSVDIQPEAQAEYTDLYAHLRASMVVLAETNDFPTDQIEQIGTDTL